MMKMIKLKKKNLYKKLNINIKYYYTKNNRKYNIVLINNNCFII